MLPEPPLEVLNEDMILRNRRFRLGKVEDADSGEVDQEELRPLEGHTHESRAASGLPNPSPFPSPEGAPGSILGWGHPGVTGITRPPRK